MMPKGSFWTPSRILSGLVFLIVFVAGVEFLGAHQVPATRSTARALVPAIWGLLAVWFSDALGGFTGSISGIDKTTPSEVIYWFGWLMLLLPGLLFFIL